MYLINYQHITNTTQEIPINQINPILNIPNNGYIKYLF